MWKKGESGNLQGRLRPGETANPAGRPRRGPGSQGGPGSRGGKTEWTPTIVKDGDSIDCLDFAQALIDSPNVPNQQKLTATAILAPFRHVKPTGEYLSAKWNEPAPQSLDEALSQQRKIIEMERLQIIKNTEADRLQSRLTAFSEMVERVEIVAEIKAIKSTLEAHGIPVIETDEAGR
jgi:hypothetical protein